MARVFSLTAWQVTIKEVKVCLAKAGSDLNIISIA